MHFLTFALICLVLFKLSYQFNDSSNTTNSTSVITTTDIIASTTVVNDNPCQTNPCLNNGTCVAFSFDEPFKCICQPNFFGEKCAYEAKDCSPNPCLNNGTCIQLGVSYICFCSPRYYGFNCEFTKPSCLPNPCNNQNCTIIGNSYVCSCNPGWTGPNCDRYNNPCSSNPCQFYETCSINSNLNGNPYYCSNTANNYGLIVFKFIGVPLIMIAFFTGIIFICTRNKLYRIFKRNDRRVPNTTTIRRSNSGQVVYIISSNVDRLPDQQQDQQQQSQQQQINSTVNSNDLLDYNEAIRISVTNEKDSQYKEEELPTYQETVNNHNLNAASSSKA